MKICLQMKSNLSPNLSYKEAVRSDTATRLGIDNTPSFEQLVVIKHLATDFFQPLRNRIAAPIYVSSLFRSRELNKKIGGAIKSDHMVQQDVAAIDMDDIFSCHHNVYNRDIFLDIYRNSAYYKLIWEYQDTPTPDGLPSPKWVHVSYSLDPEKNKERNTLFTQDGKTYLTFDPIKAKIN